MKIKELKEIIKDFPDEMGVVMLTESDIFVSPLDQAILEYYEPHSETKGENFEIDSDAEDNGLEYEEWEVTKSRGKVLVLYPKG